MSRPRDPAAFDKRDVAVGHDVIFAEGVEAESAAHYKFRSGQRFTVIRTLKPGTAYRAMVLTWPGSEIEIVAKRAHLRRVEAKPDDKKAEEGGKILPIRPGAP